MVDIKETLTKKYGPLPGYAWVGIGAAGIVLVARLRKGSGAATGDVTLTPATDGSLMGSGDLGGGGGGADLSDPGTTDSGSAGVGVIDSGETIGASQVAAGAPVGTQPFSPSFSSTPNTPRVLAAINAGAYTPPIAVAPVDSGRVIGAINQGVYNPFGAVAQPQQAAPAPQAPAPAAPGTIIRSGFRFGG